MNELQTVREGKYLLPSKRGVEGASYGFIMSWFTGHWNLPRLANAMQPQCKHILLRDDTASCGEGLSQKPKSEWK